MAYLRFLIFRLIILAVVLGVSWFSLNTLLRRTLIATWYENTGTRLAIGEVVMKLDPTQLELTDLTVTTDSEKPAKLAMIERVNVHFDRSELMRRRFFADETHLSNIRFELGGLGENGLDLTEYWNDAQSQFDLIANQVRKIPLDEMMSNNLDEAAKQLAKQFATYDYGNRLLQRWSGEIETFKTDANAIKGRLDAIKQHLANAETTQDYVNAAIGVLNQIDALGFELKKLEKTTVPEIEKKLKAERDALLAAVEKDQQKLRSLTRQKIEPIDFSEYVLGEEMREKLTGLIAWIDWSRTLAPEEDASWFDRMQFFSGKRLPGTNVPLPGIESQPEVHFGGIGLDGQALLWGQPVYFVGGIRDYSNQPRKMKKPLVLRFCISKEPQDTRTSDDYLRILAAHEAQNLFQLDQIRIGQQLPLPNMSQTIPQNATVIDFFRLPETTIIGDENRHLVLDLPTLYVTAMIDRTGDVPHDRFLVSCPDYRLPQRVLGNPQQIAFSVSPGVSQLRAELDIKGESLTGKLALLQSPITIQASLPQHMRGTPLENGLASATRALDTIQAEIEIRGTRTAPKYSFHSNIGDRLAAQVEPLLQLEWNQLNSKLTSLLNQQITTSSNLLTAVPLQEIQPLLDSLKLEHGQVAVALQQGSLDVEQLIRSQLWRFQNAEDQEKINSILASPLCQTLLNRNPQNSTNPASGTLGQMVQQHLGDRIGGNVNVGAIIDDKTDNLINRHVAPEAQNTIRSLLGGLGNSRPNTVPSPPPQTPDSTTVQAQ